jgi:hypothetical protein
MTGAFCFYEYDSTSYKVVNPIQIKSNIPKSGTQKGGTHPANWIKGGFGGKLEGKL